MTTADTIRLDQLDARIRKVWSRAQALHLIAGLLAFIRWAVPMFVLCVLIDWLTYMPVAGRVVMLVCLLAVSLHRAWCCGWRKLSAFNAVHTALKLEAHHAELTSLLVSAIQLRAHPTAGGGSTALRDRTCRLAEDAASQLRPEQAVPYNPLHRPSVVAFVLLALIGVAAVVNGQFLAAGAQRLLMPWVQIAYPTRTQITQDQATLVIKEGDSALIQARLQGVIPDQAKIFIRTGEGMARAIDLQVEKDTCTYTIASASRDFTYRIKAGDDRTPWRKVRVVPAPRIEQVRVQQQFPAYLQRQNESTEALTLTVPEATRVHWQLTLDRPVRSAQFIRDGEQSIDLQVSSDGRSLSFAEDVSASRGYHFAWVDREHGFSFTSPRYYLQVASDQPPRIELISPSGNRVAMLGRALDLVVRAQDDYGIGSMRVAYRVNQREEVAVDLNGLVSDEQGDQPVDWDYRKALPELEIGDTVSLTIEASDHYPAPQGPHTVRSETRRITFLSKEQYLEQVEKQKDRLLSRVQTVYRQQRSAHEVVRALDPEVAGYMQACQLEAIRQEMVREQVKEIAGQMQVLLDDLEANGVADADQGGTLERVRIALNDIADQHLARSAALLREQSGVVADQRQAGDPAPAAEAVNTAARELASLVLLRGIDSAQEVYARESRMLAQALAALRWGTLTHTSADEADRLAQQQQALAQWTERLITDMQAGMRYDKRPLAVLRLTRSVKDLRDAQAADQMREASKLIRQGKAENAASLQADVVRILLDAEFSVRLSGAYSTLMQTRREIAALAEAQAQLHAQTDALEAEALASRRVDLTHAQTDLRKRLLTMLLPSIPAPRAQLFDEQLPLAPPVQAKLIDADHAMADALAQLAAGDHPRLVSAQLRANQALGELSAIVDRWSVELGVQSQGLSTLVAATSERMTRIESYETRTIGLLEKTDIALADKQNVDALVETQSILADELSGFKRELVRHNTAEPDADLPPLLSRLDLAEQSLSMATRALEANDADRAIEHQEQAADALAEAYAIVVAQHERLGMLQDLLMFQRAVGFANGYMADIVAEQRDLLTATEASQPDAMVSLLPKFANMRNCMVDVAPLLDLVAGRLDVGTPLVFAKTDFEDAMASLKSGDKLDAVDAQDVAAESLASVQLLVQDVQEQTGYVAEIVSYLHESIAHTAILLALQEQLKVQTDAAVPGDVIRLAEQQNALLAEAQTHARLLVSATGMPEFEQSLPAMRQALARLQANDAGTAAEHMGQAIDLLRANNESLLAVITMVHGLPSIEVTNQTRPELIRLVDVLVVASAHKALFRQTQVADPEAIEEIAKRQADLASRGRKLAETGEPHPILSAATGSLSQAASAFASGDPQAIATSQRKADEQLRHFIIEQALVLETAVPPASSEEGSPTDDGPGSDSESEFSAGFISDFVSGEVPQDKRTEWKVLADRNRAALNQNFARELPLEFRGLLKNYYERVAE